MVSAPPNQIHNAIQTFITQRQLLPTEISDEMTTGVIKEAIEILKLVTCHRYDVLKQITPILSSYKFSTQQLRKIYAALSRANPMSPQVEKLIKQATPFSDFTEIYTLQFPEEELEVSKAELCTYGTYFITFFNSNFSHSRKINLKGNILMHSTSFMGLISRILLKQEMYNFMSMNTQYFNLIQGFMKGEADIDLADAETSNTARAIAQYFQIGDIEILFCNTIDEAIHIARKFQLHEVDLMKYKGDLTDEHIDQIIALPGLRRRGSSIDLKALFPKLNIIDEEVWKTYIDMDDLGLRVDFQVDQHKVIRHIHDMYRKLKIKDEAGITFLIIPTGLSFAKMMTIGRKHSMEFPVGELQFDDHAMKFAVEKGYAVAITNSILKGSDFNDNDVLEKRVENKGCRMPRLIELVALNLITYVSLKKSLFRGFHSAIITAPFSVGACTSSGVDVWRRGSRHEHWVGAAAMRVFTNIRNLDL